MENNVVYAILNILTGDSYIGSTMEYRRRMITHRSELIRGVHSNKPLQEAWNRDGPAAFEWMILEEGIDDVSLRSREHFWLEKEKPSYNRSMTTTSSNREEGWYSPLRDRPQSPEHAEASRKALKDFAEKRAAAGLPPIRTGMETPEWLCEKRKADATRLWADPEYRAKAVAARKGKAYNKGYKCTPEQVENRKRAGRISNMKRKHGDRWMEEYVTKYGDAP